VREKPFSRGLGIATQRVDFAPARRGLCSDAESAKGERELSAISESGANRSKRCTQVRWTWPPPSQNVGGRHLVRCVYASRQGIYYVDALLAQAGFVRSGFIARGRRFFHGPRAGAGTDRSVAGRSSDGSGRPVRPISIEPPIQRTLGGQVTNPLPASNWALQHCRAGPGCATTDETRAYVKRPHG